MPSTDSDTGSSTLDLTGVWLHDPLDPEGTAKHYQIGDESSRSMSVSPQQAGTFYAGRTFPVFDYGSTQSDAVSVGFFVPKGGGFLDPVSAGWARPAELDELVSFAESRRTLCYRDNRGRKVFGAPGDYNEADTPEGTNVSMTFTRVEYTEAVS
jgi:hypothetical protein